MTSASRKEMLSGAERILAPNSSMIQLSFGNSAPARKLRVCGACEAAGFKGPTSR